MKGQLLIERAPGEEHPASLDSDASIEAAFYVPEYHGLILNATGWGKDAVDFLLHAIARSPNNLRFHVQRINLSILKQNEASLYGALLDLFIVLAKHGQPLRSRMLEAAKPLLQDEHYETLQQHIECGLTAHDVATQHKNSILTHGISSPHQLVTRNDAQEEVNQDPILEARDHLQYGQIDAAREVLETAIDNEPEKLELYLELLDIYQYTHDNIRYHSMRQQLEENDSPILSQWLLQSESFKEDS